jgi:hypothetical protein
MEWERRFLMVSCIHFPFPATEHKCVREHETCELSADGSCRKLAGRFAKTAFHFLSIYPGHPDGRRDLWNLQKGLLKTASNSPCLLISTSSFLRNLSPQAGRASFLRSRLHPLLALTACLVPRQRIVRRPLSQKLGSVSLLTTL